MSVVGDTAAWLSDGAHWSGPDGVPVRLLQHLEVSGTALGIALLLALPPAFLLASRGRGGAAVVALANASRAVPTFAVLVLLVATPVGFGDRATVVALVLFAVPPLLTNAYTGVRDVDPDVREAARGMGMTRGQLLRRVELPLALPLVAAGVRTAAVQVVATATLAAYVGGGGLGRFIADGTARADPGMTAAGGLLVAALALAVEGVLGAVQGRLTPGADLRTELPPV
ncbi:MAG: putative transporter permease protein [Frankiales bacterium]|nr:putative transporter permease protein [Frankiales bacterium]